MFVAFSSKGDQLLSASAAGFQQYDVSATTFRRLHNETSLGAVALAAVEETSATLVACLANPGSHLANRVVVLLDLKSKQPITEMHFEEPVLGIRVNMLRLVVIMERRTHMFDFNTLAPLPQISTTSPPNTKAMGSLSGCVSYGQTSYYAWPHTELPENRGDAVVMDVLTARTMMIPAHQTSPIEALELSRSGTRLATCSTKGTLVRVFSIPAGELLYSLRRGKTEAIIDGLVFSPNATMLAVTSNSTTLHLFKCDRNPNNLGSAAGSSAIEETKSFAKITVKENVKYTMGLSEADDTLFLVTKPANNSSTETIMEVYTISVFGKDGDARKTGEFRLR